MNNRPIGVFDSGIGGLSVLYELKKAMPNEKFIYFADTKNVPYGNKSTEEIVKYSKDIVEFLIKLDIKICIIACNTISCIAIDDLKKDFNLKFISIVKSGVKSICEEKLKKLCVIGTKRTIERNIYEEEIKKINSSIEIFSIATPNFVEIVESGLINTKASKKYIDEYLGSLKSEGIDGILLGCTHYPFLKDDIKSEFKKAKIINPAKQCAIDTKKYILKNNLQSTENGDIQFYVTGNKNNFDRVKNNYIDEFKNYSTHYLIDWGKLTDLNIK